MILSSSRLIAVLIGLISITYLLTSALNDFQPKPKRDEQLVAVKSEVDTAITRYPMQALDAKEYKGLRDRAALAIVLPELPMLELAPQNTSNESKKEIGQMIYGKLIESRFNILEKEIQNLKEAQEDKFWGTIKAILAWLLGTFFTPAIAEFGKIAFGIEKKENSENTKK